jgi:hypothetical protein
MITTEEGDFSFVPNEELRLLLEDAYNAIHVANAWDFITEGSKNFSFSDSPEPELYEIASYMNMKHYNKIMFDYIMEEMFGIAYYGWNIWIERFKLYNAC